SESACMDQSTSELGYAIYVRHEFDNMNKIHIVAASARERKYILIRLSATSDVFKGQIIMTDLIPMLSKFSNKSSL
ncbi:hypothetical protein, partial [Clostridioides difficile]|uniref:hypothetical protein n=1 Tax=Clostridioides difficile TaxID=1496 RepID=UPI00197F2719